MLYDDVERVINLQYCKLQTFLSRDKIKNTFKKISMG